MIPRLLVVTDRRMLACEALAEALEALFASRPETAVGVFHRESDLPDRAALREIRRLVKACRAHRGRGVVLVRARPDLALAAGADGVHLQAGGLPPTEIRRRWPHLILGYSAHGIAEVRGVANDVDYITFSPVYSSPGKGRSVGIAALGRACRAAGGTPVLALGGITTTGRARACARVGAHGVAVIRAVLGAGDPAAAGAALLDAVEF
ncbi:MAG: thiamine phosphate synthase [Myxococcota bacterium]|nr:thiamine phosphate synthase [Myxococcota bacterium]